MVWMHFCLLFGQAVTDPLSGGAGWVGTGLLGSVLGWLLFVHLPGNQKQFFELVRAHDDLVNKITSDFRASLSTLVDKQIVRDKEIHQDFKDSLQKVVDHCEKEVRYTINEVRKEMEGMRGYVVDLTKKVNEEKRGV